MSLHSEHLSRSDCGRVPVRRALTRSLTSLVQRQEGGLLDSGLGGALSGHGDEDVALLLSRSAAVSGRRQQPQAGQSDLFPSRWSFISGGRLSLLLAAALLAGGGYWVAAAADQRPAQLLARLLRSSSQLLLSAWPAAVTAEPSWLESGQLWLVSLLYSLVCWVPGLCSEEPAGWALPAV